MLNEFTQYHEMHIRKFQDLFSYHCIVRVSLKIIANNTYIKSVVNDLFLNVLKTFSLHLFTERGKQFV